MSMVLNPAQLTLIRATVAQMLPDTSAINHAVPGTTNADGSGEGGTTVVASSPCRIAPLGGSPTEQVFADRLQGVSGFVFTFPFDVAISEKDTITYQGGTYQVIGVMAPTSFMMSVRVACKRIT